MRRLRSAVIACVGMAALVLTACTAMPGAAPISAPSSAKTLGGDAPVVAFYGDSYTLGTGASEPSRRWSTIISENRGWHEFNPSVNGLGFYTNRDQVGADLPGEIIEADPEIVIVTMGLNDVFSYRRAGADIHDQIVRDLDRLDSELPGARIIVVEPFWYMAERSDGLDVIIDWVHAAADDIGADYIPGASRWIQGRDGEMAADGLHPDDAGYDLIARKMDAALSDIGL